MNNVIPFPFSTPEPIEDVPCVLDGHIKAVRFLKALAAAGYVCTYDQDANAFRIVERAPS